MTGRQTTEAIEREAARWVMRLDREGETPELRAAIERWVADSPRRRGVLLQAEAAWVVADLPRPATHAHMPSSTPVPGYWIRRGVLAALGSALAASIAMYVGMPSSERYETTIGEVRRVPLEDRSTIAINTGSKIDVAYTTDRRRISLDRGEAWFQVAHDKARPFIVSAGQVRVEAVGTAFSVRRRSGGADVMVTEGVVHVWSIGADMVRRSVTAGSAAFVADTGAMRTEAGSALAIERRLAWRAGQLDLAGETLGAASAEFNRYNAMAIAVDPALANKRLYGVFRLDDPEGFARTAAVTLGLSVRKENGTMRIVPRTARSE